MNFTYGWNVEEIKIRQVETNDMPFIYQTWLKNYKYSSSFAKNIHEDVFYPEHTKVLNHIFGKANFLIACFAEDPTVIFGYFVYEPNVAHFLFVKQSFRKMGIATMLLKESGLELEKTTFTHWTYDLAPLFVTNKLKGITYNPYMI